MNSHTQYCIRNIAYEIPYQAFLYIVYEYNRSRVFGHLGTAPARFLAIPNSGADSGTAGRIPVEPPRGLKIDLKQMSNSNIDQTIEQHIDNILVKIQYWATLNHIGGNGL